MNGKSIIGLKDPLPSNCNFPASVNFFNKTVNDSNAIISGIISTKIKESEEASIMTYLKENVFLKVMDDDLFKEDDDDILKVGVADKDFHQVNKKTYLFRIDYDSEIGYYSTRLSIDLVYLPRGYYTIAFEMYPSTNKNKDGSNNNRC